MVKREEIEKIRKNGQAPWLEYASIHHQWFLDRSLPHTWMSLQCEQGIMRYIETLEDDRRHLLASVMQLLTIVRGEQNYHNDIILKAQHLMATIDQPQHEREAAR